MTRLEPKVEYVGPFEATYVTIDNWRVPHLTAYLVPGGKVDFVLDRRLSLEVDAGDADRVAHFIADAIAIAKGYACFPSSEDDGPQRMPDFTQMHGITMAEREEVEPPDDPRFDTP